MQDKTRQDKTRQGIREETFPMGGEGKEGMGIKGSLVGSVLLKPFDSDP